jgi:predicted CxxxxCH...CXXCH cytochrome family protein
MAHAGYNFPCHRCHIPDDEGYIFRINGNTSIGFDQQMNPGGVYENKKCSNLYCHSNGRKEDGYAAPIRWDALEGFCIYGCPVDEYDGHFLYCDKCHATPPAVTDFHLNLDKDRDCDVCHPHKGIYEGSKGGFYKHVNGEVDVKKVYCDYNMPEEEVDKRCLECHDSILKDPPSDFGSDSDKGLKHMANSNCLGCHDAVCSLPDNIEHYNYKGDLLLFFVDGNWNDTGCGACHNESHLTKESEKIAFRNLKDSHGRISVGCFVCHYGHYALDNINTSQCIACHIPERDVKVRSGQYLHNKDPNKDSREDPKECYVDFNCDDCHSKTHKKGKMTFAEWGGGDEEEIEKNCQFCHTTIYCDVTDETKIIDETGEDKPAHTLRPEAKCSNCHNIFIYDEEEKVFKLKKRHYRIPLNLDNIEWAWEEKGDGIENNDCGVCHPDEDKELHEELHTECEICHYNHSDLQHIQEAECVHCHRSTIKDGIKFGLGDIKVGEEYLHKKEEDEEEYHGFTCPETDTDTNTDAERLCCIDCHSNTHKKGKMTFTEWGGEEGKKIEEKCNTCHSSLYCDWTDEDWVGEGKRVHRPDAKCTDCHNIFIFDEEEKIYKIKKEHYIIDPNKTEPINLENIEWAWEDIKPICTDDNDGPACDPKNNNCGVCHKGEPNPLDPNDPNKRLHDLVTLDCRFCHISHSDLDHIREDQCASCHIILGEVMVKGEYIHNKHEGLPCSEAVMICCIECHSKTHKKGRMAFTDVDSQDEIEGKCKICHNDEYLETISVVCNAQGVHTTKEKCLNCHNVLIQEGNNYKFIEDHYNRPTNLEYMEEALGDQGDGLEGNDCSVCHKNVSTGLHNFKQKCYDCHDNHCELNIGEAECAYCHKSDKNLKQFGGEGFLHDQYNEKYTGSRCKECHSNSHIPGEEMTFTEGETREEIEGKCRICHNDEDLKKISVSCNGQGNHEARDNCLNCHNVFTKEGDIYRIKEGHYNMPTNLENMKWAWSSGVGNDCGICHTQPVLHKSVPVSEVCENCHVKEKHCEIKNISPGWEGDNTCGACHAEVVIAGQDLHSKIPSDVSCVDCHGDGHRSADSIYLYSDDPGTCKYCHGASLGINVLCNGREVNGTHSPKAAENCNACHPGVSGGTSEHYLNAGPVNLVKSWQGDNSCGACHIDASVRGTPIHVALGLNSDCAQCHGNHCDMIYGDTPAKCIACHSPNPTIIDICGPGSITTHYAFDSLGINQAAIQDCLSCHVEPLGGGEANPLQHIDNPNTFVKDGACLGCHSLARVRHGATDLLGCISCHPTHCVTEYARNDACIWCHTTNPPIVDICKMGIGITSHLAFDSSAFNQIQITNCIGCHVEPITGGEANPINHINDPMTYVNPLTCMGCHTVVVPHGASGLPWAGGVWPAVNCYTCHPTHCISSFCDNQACVWCHTDAPLLQNVCGKPGLVPHTGDCVNCHVAGAPTGGECNPADHMNGLTYVRDGTCLGCHANVTTTHGPGTETCMLCHPVHCTFTYCSEPQCKLCHNQPAFEIVSDYGCGIGLHDPPAYKECNRCHPGECYPQNHKLGPNDQGMPTDISGMKLGWKDCGLCHADAQSIHSPGMESCTLCHSGTGTSVHSCLELDYCTETKCKLCHDQNTFDITSDYGCGSKTGGHTAAAYGDCTKCHIKECTAENHLNATTDVSNMPLNWDTCGLCHADAQATHTNCKQSCTACHSGTGNHSCLELNYCIDGKCKCCHIEPEFDITSDYGCKSGKHAATAYKDCATCHGEECTAEKHLDTITDVSSMPLAWSSCGLCHTDAQAGHNNCDQPCTACHTGQGNHLCGTLDYCSDNKCRCCHVNVSNHRDTQCDCSTCHSAECDPDEHDITGASTNHPLNTDYYNYNGTSGNKGCNCCHGYPPQCVCVGISNTQDHCLEGADNCNPEIYDCMPCHTLFNGQPNHIVAAYGTPANTASCACHGDAFGAGTSGAHEKHLTTQVMAPVYGSGTGNVIDCQACHSSTTSSAEHVVCDGQSALVQFDTTLPMIGETDSYTPGTGSCNIYCHSDGTKDPLGIYTYILGSPPLWNQTAGASCGNAVLGTAAGIYQCHGYPPDTHPGGAGGGAGGTQNCIKCHPTPLLGTAPNNTSHINGAVDIAGGGLGGGGGVGIGVGVGGGMPLP